MVQNLQTYFHLCRVEFYELAAETGEGKKKRKVCNVIFYVVGHVNDGNRITYHACSVHKLPPYIGIVEAATL